MYKYDFHVHTEYSPDSTSPLKSVLEAAVKKGLDGIAICDHDTREGGLKAVQIVADNPELFKNFVVIPGVEVSTAEGHLLVLDPESDIPPG